MRKYLVIAALAVAGLFIFGFGGGKSGLVSYEELQAKIAKKDNFVLLDVRTPEEFAEGHIAGAVLLPYDQVEQKAASMLPEKEKPIIVYCRSGRRSAIAAAALRGPCGGRVVYIWLWRYFPLARSPREVICKIKC